MAAWRVHVHDDRLERFDGQDRAGVDDAGDGHVRVGPWQPPVEERLDDEHIPGTVDGVLSDGREDGCSHAANFVCTQNGLRRRKTHGGRFIQKSRSLLVRWRASYWTSTVVPIAGPYRHFRLKVEFQDDRPITANPNAIAQQGVPRLLFSLIGAYRPGRTSVVAVVRIPSQEFAFT
jgi:hypothetical protein